MQAMEAIKFIVNSGRVDTKHLTLFNLMSHHFLKIEKAKDDQCPLCGVNKVIFNILEENYEPDTSCIIDPSSLDFDTDCLVDIREKHELAGHSNFCFESNHIPMSTFNEEKINRTDKSILFCQTGKRSLRLSKDLRSKGFSNVYSLNGGIKRLISDIPYAVN